MDIGSKREDTLRAIYYIKNTLKDDVTINRISSKGSIVTGRYCHNTNALDIRKKGIVFSLSYNEDEFMRLLIMDDEVEHTNEELMEALSNLGRVLSGVTDYKGEVVGKPIGSYSLRKGNKRFLSMDWAFVDENEYLRALSISASDGEFGILKLDESYINPSVLRENNNNNHLLS